MSYTQAIQFVQNNGNPIEQARLSYLLFDQPASPSIIAEFCSLQNQDGSWSPFWAEKYSSLDATCFHLAQAYQLGVGKSEAAIAKAFTFIAHHQKSNGSWEEEQSGGEMAPPWAKPGELSAKLYLTANCGYWLAISRSYQENARKAALFLANNLNHSGQLPSFLQTHWLAIGIWRYTGLAQQAEQTTRYLATRLRDFSANNLTWMISVLWSVQVPVNHPFIIEAVARLLSLQQSNGQWQSDDGPEYDVHTTLEALFALKLCERI